MSWIIRDNWLRCRSNKVGVRGGGGGVLGILNGVVLTPEVYAASEGQGGEIGAATYKSPVKQISGGCELFCQIMPAGIIVLATLSKGMRVSWRANFAPLKGEERGDACRARPPAPDDTLIHELLWRTRIR